MKKFNIFWLNLKSKIHIFKRISTHIVIYVTILVLDTLRLTDDETPQKSMSWKRLTIGMSRCHPNKWVNPKPAKVSCAFKRSQSGSGARSATGAGPLRSLKSTQLSIEDRCFPLWTSFLRRRFSLQQDLVPSGPQSSQSDLSFHYPWIVPLII